MSRRAPCRAVPPRPLAAFWPRNRPGGPVSLIGYARVSTSGQLPGRQQHALAETGCLRVFADKLPGKISDRPEMAACLDYLRSGDTLVVASQDRLCCSGDLSQIVGTRWPVKFHVSAAGQFIRELISYRPGKLWCPMFSSVNGVLPLGEVPSDRTRGVTRSLVTSSKKRPRK